MQDFIIKELTAAANVDSVKTTLILRVRKNTSPESRSHERCRRTVQAALPPGWFSLTSSALTAVVVGFASTILLIMEAADAVGANAAEKASWAAALVHRQAITTLILSWRYKMPIITAWSTPGAALIATSSAAGIDYPSAIGAFIAAGLLTCLTAMFKPVARLIEKIPASIAAAMLAGVLLRYSMGVPGAAIELALAWSCRSSSSSSGLRVWQPLFAVPVVVAAGIVLAAMAGVFDAGCCSLGDHPTRMDDAQLQLADHRRPRRAALSRHHGLAESARFRGAQGVGLSAAGHWVRCG